MTLDQKNEQRASLKMEASARREVLRRLEHPLKLLKVAVDKETAKAEERMETMLARRAERRGGGSA